LHCNFRCFCFPSSTLATVNEIVTVIINKYTSRLYLLIIIDSQSLMISSSMPSCDNLDRRFCVETTISSGVARSLLVRALGKRSFTHCRALIHMALSSLDTHLKWRVFVPVNTESRLSSNLLKRTEETCKQT